MSTSTRETYHHGDLRAALLEVADIMLDEGDAGAISLREVARRAGVSATATYRHFQDKQALLAALAAKGFTDFGYAIQQAAKDAENPLAAIGQAYVRFALDRPGRFRLMYGPAIIDRSKHPDLQEALKRIQNGFSSMVAERKDLGNESAVASLRLWCMVHGLSQLLLDGMLQGHDPELLAQAITGTNLKLKPEP
jgi:AcrR family transcriptional regulator